MDFGKIGEELFGDISEKFDSFCFEVDEAINRKLSAFGAQMKGFWSEIVKDEIPKSPKNFIDVEEEELTNFSDSRMPRAILDDEKNNINICPIPEVNIVVPDDHLQRESSLVENEAMGMYNNSNAGDKENCIDEAEISSLGSYESISGSCIEWETSGHVDTNTEVSSDRSVASSKLSKAKLSDPGVESDDLLSMLSLGKSDVNGTEDGLDLEDEDGLDVEDYEKVDEISQQELRTVGANGPMVTDGFMHATQSQLAKPELFEDYFVVNTSDISSIPGLEKINGTSKLKSVEIKKNKHWEDEEQMRSFALTLPTTVSVGRDEEFLEDDWVVVEMMGLS